MILFKYRPWNEFTKQILCARSLYFPTKNSLNDPAELVHPVRFTEANWEDVHLQLFGSINDNTWHIFQTLDIRFKQISLIVEGDALEWATFELPEVWPPEEWSRYRHIHSPHWRCVEATCDRLADVEQMIRFYFLNLAEDVRNMYGKAETFNLQLNDRLEKLGVLSLSLNAKSSVMWAHYAANHQGVVLMFDTDRDPLLRKAKKVDYVEERPINSVTAIVDNLYKKAKDWSYEQEYRVLIGHGGANYGFKAEALAGVILGSHMSEASREEVIECAQVGAPVAVYEAFPNENTYAIEHRLL
ncbi:DUF2971 domain-containing protein [Terriglobus roseus]|uniref:DUF2971 domain-containing protein n=1 Tax=Terriglobus roseus TaxID=392734 RepID=A0A1G7G624_9BACT|nr:DUF2971 domain-containing protein [Terriglobus roseus]SDE83557.1 Protein of unknown function [Terriglobus roseus]